jgi:hypothetical protein
MDTVQQQAVESAASIWLGAQGPLDREYEERQRRNVIMVGDPNDRKVLPHRFYSQVQVELNAERADQWLGPILAGFTQEQFAEYMRLTTK